MANLYQRCDKYLIICSLRLFLYLIKGLQFFCLDFEQSKMKIKFIILQIFLPICVNSQCIEPGICAGKLIFVDIVQDIKICQENCTSDSLCRWFTYHPKKKSCHKFQSCKELVLEKQGFLTTKDGANCQTPERYSCTVCNTSMNPKYYISM